MSDAERSSLTWLAGFEVDTVSNVVAVITRARRTRQPENVRFDHYRRNPGDRHHRVVELSLTARAVRQVTTTTVTSAPRSAIASTRARFAKTTKSRS